MENREAEAFEERVHVGSAELRREYDAMRAKLEWLLAQPDKDMPEIDRLVDELEHTQLRLKGDLGIQGNNPIE